MNHNQLQNGEPGVKDDLALRIASLGPIGHLPQAPGTWSAFLATVGAPFLFIPLSLFWKLTCLVVIFFLGAWTAGISERKSGQTDPGWVVIDELLGQWLCFIFISQPSFSSLLLGFVLFRLFDIFKPFPIKNAETWLSGGYGVMLDDLLAGIYAALCLQGILSLIQAI